MWELILTSFYFILPGYFANMMPPIGSKLKLPLDFPVSKKYLGTHKTYRGFYLGYLGAFLILSMQQNNLLITPTLRELDYLSHNLFLLAFFFGFSALFGDSIKSFFKRKKNIPSGAAFFPWDQLDFIIAIFIFTSPFIPLPWQYWLIIFLMTPLLHLFTNTVAFQLGFKDKWY